MNKLQLEHISSSTAAAAWWDQKVLSYTMFKNYKNKSKDLRPETNPKTRDVKL